MMGFLEMGDPLVSIVMTARNAEKFVTEALRSISEQYYDNIEVCIHDDGSTDRTYQKALKETAANIGPRGFKCRFSQSSKSMGVGAGRDEARTRLEARGRG